MSAWSTDYFLKLLGWLEPTAVQTGKLDGHRSSIKTRLEASFSLASVKTIGSHSRGTAIRGRSDLDLLAVIRKDDLSWGSGTIQPGTLVQKFRSTLQERFPNTDVGKDGQAIVMKFDQGESVVDVVPAVFRAWGDSLGRPVFRIPDGYGGWLDTSPEAHEKYIRDADTRSGSKLCRVVKLVKYWRECREPRVPLASFHLELLLASEGACTVGKTYADCLKDTFDLLAARQGRGLHDPLGISGTIQAASTAAKQVEVANAAKYASEHAWTALMAENAGNTSEAYRQWDLVFNGKLPARP